MSSEQVVLVDMQDQAIGVEEKLRAHELGLLHRAFSVFVVRKAADSFQILLQQRQKDKYHCGGLWTNTCCSHPGADEDIVAAAQRRLFEEMGLDIPLRQLDAFTYRVEFNNGLIEHEYDHVLVGYYKDEVILPNVSEVQDVMWCEVSQLLHDLQHNPSNYTPWLLPALEILCKRLVRS